MNTLKVFGLVLFGAVAACSGDAVDAAESSSAAQGEGAKIAWRFPPRIEGQDTIALNVTINGKPLFNTMKVNQTLYDRNTVQLQSLPEPYLLEVSECHDDGTDPSGDVLLSAKCESKTVQAIRDTSDLVIKVGDKEQARASGALKDYEAFTPDRRVLLDVHQDLSRSRERVQGTGRHVWQLRTGGSISGAIPFAFLAYRGNTRTMEADSSLNESETTDEVSPEAEKSKATCGKWDMFCRAMKRVTRHNIDVPANLVAWVVFEKDPKLANDEEDKRVRPIVVNDDRLTVLNTYDLNVNKNDLNEAITTDTEMDTDTDKQLKKDLLKRLNEGLQVAPGTKFFSNKEAVWPPLP